LENIKRIIQRYNKYDWKPKKGRTCILLIDLQEYFHELIQPILANLKKIIDVARKTHTPLFFTQHGHEPDEDKGMLGRWWGDSIIRGSSEARLLSKLNLSPQDIVVEKNRYSAFYRTELEKKLKEHKIEDIVIGGVMTNLCCETTARDAFVRDYRVFFLADGSSTADEELQLATLKNLAYGFAVLMSCGQLIQILKTWKTR
jgi:isochorismate hydrolase